MPESTQLKRIRAAIAEQGNEFRSMVESSAFRRRFGRLEGEKLQRAPLGYPADHPWVEYLKYKSFYMGRTLAESRCLRPEFAKEVVEIYAELLPFVRFLNRALGGDASHD